MIRGQNAKNKNKIIDKKNLPRYTSRYFYFESLKT